MSHDVFISYSTKDKSTADAICHILEQNSLQCWIAPRNISSGKNYSQEILDGIDSTKIVVLVYSAHSQASDFVRNEIDFAFNKGKAIIPFKIDETMPEGDMGYYLKNKQWLEAYPEPEKEFKTLIRDALRLCGEEYERPITYSFADFAPDDMSGLKKDYTSLILLFTPFYWASFLYMGLIGGKNLWKIAGLIYLIPSVVCLIFFFEIWGIFFLFFPVFMTFLWIFIIFWLLAIMHGLLIRNDFLTRKSVLRVMYADDKMFDALLEEYSQI